MSTVTKNPRPGAKPGNKNAIKTDDEKASSFIHARCLTSDKASWVKAALRHKLNLTEWIVKTLNEAATK